MSGRPPGDVFPTAGRSPFTVSQVTAIVRGAMAAAPELEDVLVEGEVSNLSSATSGHLYFTLKDAGASLRCVCFRTHARSIGFRPEAGMTVIAHGRLDVYEAGGTYQLYVERLDPSGVGALALAVEQCRRRLAAEGLLDDGRKRPLPVLPRRVAVVTSRTGAAFRDVCTVMERRAPGVDVVLSPATVQGEGAAPTLVTALARAQMIGGVEVILLVRGGGAVEDLMPFNDEALARAIRRSRVPVVTGIGHQTDLTIADQVADRRGATPSAAAEVVVPSFTQLRADIAGRSARLDQAVQHGLDVKRQSGERLAERLRRLSPLQRLPGLRQHLDGTVSRLRGALLSEVAVKQRRLAAATANLQMQSPLIRLPAQREGLRRRTDRLEASLRGLLTARRAAVVHRDVRLQALSPERVIERGYSITLDDASGRVVASATSLRPGQRLRTRLPGGEARSDVVDVRVTPSGAAGSESPAEGPTSPAKGLTSPAKGMDVRTEGAASPGGGANVDGGRRRPRTDVR
ncbi:MAG: exodeoxyribonuclease VII large subunit [Candidatus Dormibacteria bacterium]